jgi:hypothetical protein
VTGQASCYRSARSPRAGAWLSGGPQVTAAELVAFSVLSPPVVAVLALLPRAFPAGNTDRRRLFTVAYATLGLVLGLLAGAALTGRLTPAALYMGTAIVAVAPFGLAWLLLAEGLIGMTELAPTQTTNLDRYGDAGGAGVEMRP